MCVSVCVNEEKFAILVGKLSILESNAVFRANPSADVGA